VLGKDVDVIVMLWSKMGQRREFILID